MRSIEDMAHEYALLHMSMPRYHDVDDKEIVAWAVEYAQAMQTELSKLNRGVPDAILEAERLKCSHIWSDAAADEPARNCLNCGQTEVGGRVMDNFKEVAHKTVAELFDMLKEKQAEIEFVKAQLSLQRDRNKALEAELTSSRNYGADLKAQLECCRKENAVLLEKVGDGEKRIDKYRKLTISIRNEFDLWSDDSEFAGVIEAQIENLEALRGAND